MHWIHLLGDGRSVDRIDTPNPNSVTDMKTVSDAFNRDWTASNGDIRTGKGFDIAGIEFLKSNHVPTTNPHTATTSGAGKYFGGFSTTIDAIAHPNAVGNVKLLDFAVEGDYYIRRRGTLTIAEYAMGHGILRPEAVVELSSGAMA